MEEKHRPLKKVFWQHVRDKVKLIEPAFAALIDQMSPDNTFSLYLANYPYGAVDADTISSLFPDGRGTYYRITDRVVPKNIMNDLGYSANSTPLGMVLDKQIECFIDLKTRTLPWYIYTPGKIFPLTRVLPKRNQRIYAPNGLLSSTSGARSTFLLPSIGCTNKHLNLQVEFNLQIPPPKTMYEHWQIFKEIVNSKAVLSDWNCCIMYFSYKWLEKILNDRSWLPVKEYLLELAWHEAEFEINRVQYEIIFSLIQQRRNLKPNPYLADTAKHLFAIAIGAVPGYIPAQTEEALPLNLLQKVFIETYDIKKYLPTIMQPAHFHFETDNLPIYYSLQNASSHIFSPKSREVASTLYEMRELENILKVFRQELNKNNLCTAHSILSNIASKIEFRFYHNKSDRHKIVSPSDFIILKDKRFKYCNYNKNIESLAFAENAAFFRGCISIQG